MSNTGCDRMRHCHGQGRGRARAPRHIGQRPMCTEYTPSSGNTGQADTTVICASELEVLRLVDVLGYTQEQAAEAMGVSRKTAWADIKAARKKLVLALLLGNEIRICEDIHASGKE